MSDGVPEHKPCTHALPLYFTPRSFMVQEHGCMDAPAQLNVGPGVASADGLGVLCPWQGPAWGRGSCHHSQMCISSKGDTLSGDPKLS